MKYFTLDTSGFLSGEFDLPETLSTPLLLPIGTFIEPPATQLANHMLKLVDGAWVQTPAFTAQLWLPVIAEDGSVTATAKGWGEGDFGTDPFALGWTDLSPPTIALGETLGWNATSKKWTVVAEKPAAKAARETAALQARREGMVCSAMQARQALNAVGKLDDVEMAISTAPKEVQIAWEFAGEFNRLSPSIAALAGAVGLDDAALDALFIAAAQISA